MSINLIIPAAGAATRLRPLSSNTSKVMVRVNGKPCLDYILEHASKNAELSEIVIVDGQFNDIREYCSKRHPNVKFVNQPSLNGPRDAIALGMNALDDPTKPVIVWLGDAIILEENLPLGTDFLLCKEVDNQSAWCMWDGEKYYNKPSGVINNAVALVGLYSFKNGKNAQNAFNCVDLYDISYALEVYGKYERVVTNLWYDIGDLPTYYKTCAELLNLKSRAFNNISYDADLCTITKTPDYHDPISVETLHNERTWYNNLTPEQSLFVPRVLPSKTNLTMSYESGTLLSDLMLYEDLSESAWEYIIDKVFRIKLKYFNNQCDEPSFIHNFYDYSKRIWLDKTRDRLDNTTFKESYVCKLKEIAVNTYRQTKPISGMHGDLHFGNILYNQQTDQIKLIDPRGEYGHHVGTCGDNLYDFAKLAHDLYHGYGAMVNNTAPNEVVKKIFKRKLKEYDLPVDIIIDAGVLLIATCIPLHYDDKNRQKRFKDYVEGYLNEKYSI
jgi:GTP:adenosylcobinamide-phosphate guanylyltransferase